MPPRALLICAEDTEAAGAACRWALNNVFRDLAAASADAAADAAAEAEGAGADVFHLVYVVKALHPPSEVFHGPPGTSFQFGGGAGGAAGEAAVIAGAQAALEARYLPILREKMARYRLHLFAERADAPADKVVDCILRCADDVKADLVVLAAHGRAHERDALGADVGSVAAAVLKRCRRPLALVRAAAA